MVNINVFRAPQVVLYGSGSFHRVATEAAQRGKKALIVSDPIMKSLGNINQCIEYLLDEQIQAEIYTGVISEPTDVYVQEALSLFQKSKCDLIISLGGGSCIDTAKAVAVLATNSGFIGDYMGGAKQVEQLPVPHIAIPTTAGTGSEVTDVTVITNTQNEEKMMIKQPLFMPSVAIVDPMLTLSSPKKVTAATGIDALSHAIEAYLSKRAQPMTDSLALSAIELIVSNIKTVYEVPTHLAAREAMSTASMYAGMAFSNASVCLVHGMSRPIGALFHVAHGESNAMLLPAVLEFSKDSCVERLATIGRIFSKSPTLSDHEMADLAVKQIKSLCYELDIPNMKDLGIEQQTYLRNIERMAADAIRSGSPANNPRVPTKQEIEELYKLIYNYQFATRITSP